MKLWMHPRQIRFKMTDTIRCDYLPGCQYKIWQDAREFCFTTDAVFLGHFPHLVRQAKVLELGCGTGAISMLLENRGAAFGIFQGQKTFFIITTLLLLSAALYFYIRLPYTKRFAAFRICTVLVAAGGIGNMIDRLCNNYVTDFFYFELIDFPVFNVADIYVVLAMCLFCYLAFFYFKEEDYQYFTFRGKKSVQDPEEQE